MDKHSDASYTYHLPEHVSQFLAELPESSMGSQSFDVVLSNGKIVPNILIHGCREMISRSAFNIADITGFKETNGKIWKLTNKHD